jgi:succinyl-diaminopimelate desuccinylase
MSGEELLRRTAELVDIPSVSHNEAAIADHIASVLGAAPWLELTRVGANIVARTLLGRPRRLVLAGHVDTVPANGNEKAVIEGTVLHGLGSADMKSGVATMIELALAVPEPAVDLSFVFYACEEVSRQFSGLLEIEAADASLLAGDAAILGEPTGALVEAGCQGVLRVAAVLRGERAHSARPWTGVNAIHRLAPLLTLVASYEERRPVIDGCEYREALQAVEVSGGVAANVVPDEARVWLNHRFAPDRTVDEAYAVLSAYLGGVVDEISLEDSSPAAPPGLGHPLLAALVERSGAPPRAKLGWTDVAFFTERGVPAANYGPGEPTVAHSAHEQVGLAQIVTVYETLRALVC